MISPIYPWKRFWSQRGTPITLDYHGYLADPDRPYGDATAFSLADLATKPCLILLGEPGIGKSQTLHEAITMMQEQTQTTGDTVLSFRLRMFQTDYFLVQTIFDTPEFRAWETGRHRLYLFLDDFDESLLHIKTLAALLENQFERYRGCMERFFLRVACRTAVWPIELEIALQTLWGKDNVEALELTPLRQIDVGAAAACHNIDAITFLNAVEQAGVISFAQKPITLRMLLTSYEQTGRLPHQQSEIYELGCLRLCEAIERQSQRRDTNSQLSPYERVKYARQIAYLMMFANKASVYMSSVTKSIPEGTITIDTLNMLLEITAITQRTTLYEVFETGLFSARGESQLGWAHKTYMEYLAARFLYEQQMTLPQIQSLFLHPEDGKIIPQLVETAAWLASMRRDVFDLLVPLNPLIFLKSDVIVADQQNRALVVIALLNEFDQQHITDTSFNHSLYRRLAYSGIATQLKPYIIDKTKGWLVRRVAMNIAEVCQLRILQDDVLQVVLDHDDFYPTRSVAARTLIRIGNDAAKAKLRPLVFDADLIDPDDELRGCALLALWPESLTAEELFTILPPPQQRVFGSSYHRFLTHHCLDNLSITSLPTALHWAAEQLITDELDSFRQLADEIMVLGWTHLDEADILAPFTTAAAARLHHHLPIIGRSLHELMPTTESQQDLYDHWIANSEKRRRVVQTILSAFDPSTNTWVLLLYDRLPLLLSTDFEWLIDQLGIATNPIHQTLLVNLIDRLFQHTNRDHVEALHQGIAHNPLLHEQMSNYFRAIPLDSEQAMRQKAIYEQMQERQVPQQNKQSSKSPRPNEVLQQQINQISAAPESWWKLTYTLVFNEEGISMGHDYEPDLRKLPGWSSASPAIQRQIVHGAVPYLKSIDLTAEAWWGENIRYWAAIAGYKALFLMACESPDELAHLSLNIWNRWSWVITAYPLSNVGNAKIYHQRLVTCAYTTVPDMMLMYLEQHLVKQATQETPMLRLWQWDTCWDNRIAETLLANLRNGLDRPVYFHGLLETLLHHNNTAAYDFAVTLLVTPISQRETIRRSTRMAAELLLQLTGDASWEIIWPLFNNEPAFAQEFVMSIAGYDYRRGTPFFTKLTEDSLANLYSWVLHHFPFAEDPVNNEGGMHEVTDRDTIASWRDELLIHLQQRGTVAAVTAIQQIADAFPNEDRIRWTLIFAKDHMRRMTWIPHDVTILKSLMQHRERRLVDNADQLTAVILESLRRLEQKLHGEIPAVIDLWNETGRGAQKKYTPKSENQFSDYLKRHLDTDLNQRGIVINREVVIRPGTGNHDGERTDIHVNAVIPGQYEGEYSVITVIIEVKGCWHKDVETAMETQLVQRYLAGNTCRHGIYLVGWFYSPKWKKPPEKWPTKEMLQDSLDLQAASMRWYGVAIKAVVLDMSI